MKHRAGPVPTPVVIVTGASSGIGRTTALLLAQQGNDLVLAARSVVSLNEVVAECVALGARAISVPTDVSDAQQVDHLLSATLAHYQRLDTVIHAAAAVAYGRFDEIPAAVFDQVIQTNLIGTANVARAALRHFNKVERGNLVLVGSLLGKIAVPYMSPYVTSKWAVHGLTRMLQAESRRSKHVHVSLISPGSVDTPAYSQAANYTGWEGRPPPPVDPPDKVARAILRAVKKPRRDVSVGPANPVVVLGFRLFPGIYDLLVTPLVKAAALSSTSVGPGSGTVFSPSPGGNSQYGKWGRHWLRPVVGGAVVAAGSVAAWAVSVKRQSPGIAGGNEPAGGNKPTSGNEPTSGNKTKSGNKPKEKK